MHYYLKNLPSFLNLLLLNFEWMKEKMKVIHNSKEKIWE